MNTLLASAALFNSINTSLPTLTPQLYSQLSNTTFKVLSSYAPIANVLDNDDFSKMFIAQFGEQFSLIPESVEFAGHTDNRNQVLISAFIKANTISRPYTEASVKGMSVITANIFKDNDDTIWKVVGSGDNRRIVQTIREDFKAIINARISARRNELIASVAFKGMPANVAEPGDFSLFYNTQSEEMDCGFTFKSADAFRMFSYNTNAFVDADPHTIVRGIDLPEIKRTMTHVSFDESTMDNFDMTDGQFTPARRKQYQDYMSFLYNGTDYFAKLKNLLSLREQTGRSDIPVSTMR